MIAAAYLNLSADRVALAGGLILINGLVSLLLQLRLESRLLWASLRMVVQLSLIGYLLQWVFETQSEPWVLVLMCCMTLIAGVSAIRRTNRRYSGIWLDGILSVWVSSWLVTAYAAFVVVQWDPWYAPRYAIPFLGMILGNTLNGISLGLDRLGSELTAQRDRIETMLALGATRWEAARSSIREAIRTGMIPIINSMMVTGIVSLPGMMTGQLVAGMDPMPSVRYQIVIIFLIASCTALGTVGVVLLGYRRLFNREHQFLSSRLIRVSE